MCHFLVIPRPRSLSRYSSQVTAFVFVSTVEIQKATSNFDEVINISGPIDASPIDVQAN